MTTTPKDAPKKRKTPTVAQLIDRINQLEQKVVKMEETSKLNQARFLMLLGDTFRGQGQAVIDKLYPPTFELLLVDDDNEKENDQTIRVLREEDNSFFVFAKAADGISWLPLEPSHYAQLDLDAAYLKHNCVNGKTYRFNVIKGNVDVR